MILQNHLCLNKIKSQMNKSQIRELVNRELPIIFEIGCADGIDTIEFIDVFGDNMKLYCFEPDNRNADVFLNGGFRPIRPDLLHGIKRDNVIFENKAVGNIDGIVEFNQSSTIYSSSLKKPTDLFEQTWGSAIKFNNILQVECVTLDKYLNDNQIDVIDFMWADVQGAEDLMIMGGSESFKSKIRYLYTEYSGVEFYEGAPNRSIIESLLGDNWEVIHDFTNGSGGDVLLKNKQL